MRDESEEAVKRRFASLIANLLRSSAQEHELSPQRELQASVERSERRLLVRLHWRKRGSQQRDASCVDELICYQEFPQPGDCDVVIVITREVDAHDKKAAARSVH